MKTKKDGKKRESRIGKTAKRVYKNKEDYEDVEEGGKEA